MQTIDDITDGKKKKLFALLRWPITVQGAVCTWPCFNINREVSTSETQSNCAACGRLGAVVRVLMYGQPYNSTTLEGCQPDPNAINEKVKYCNEYIDMTNLYNVFDGCMTPMLPSVS